MLATPTSDDSCAAILHVARTAPIDSVRRPAASTAPRADTSGTTRQTINGGRGRPAPACTARILLHACLFHASSVPVHECCWLARSRAHRQFIICTLNNNSLGAWWHALYINGEQSLFQATPAYGVLVSEIPSGRPAHECDAQHRWIGASTDGRTAPSSAYLSTPWPFARPSH